MTPKRRRNRKQAADCQAGVREVAGGGWALPAFGLEAWFVARAVPGEHRPGFRAWIAGHPERPKARALADWDRLYGRYRSE